MLLNGRRSRWSLNGIECHPPQKNAKKFSKSIFLLKKMLSLFLVKLRNFGQKRSELE
jgi:hypothetical protein